ncbi:MAG: translocation/assembly module TamB domain-containing protein [Nitrosomonas sp.]|nr:translocation/assembly module TamB domain-containing protein [Nitrosomonas sp.]
MSETNQPAPPATTTPPASRFGTFKTWLLGALLLMLFMLAGGLYWLGTTTSGLQRLLTAVSQASGNALVFTDVTGNLQSLRIGLITYQDSERAARVEKLAVSWQPRDLLNATLLIKTFTADLVEVHSAPSDDPASLPDNLQLPIDVIIHQLGIRSLRTYTLGDDTPGFSAQQVALRLTSGDTFYRLPVFSLTLEQGKLAGRLQIGTHAPFDLSSQLTLHAWPTALAVDYPESSHISLRLGGNLEQILAALAIQAGELQGRGTIALRPFAVQPLASLDLTLDGLNPQRFSADLPVANLNLAGNLEETASGALQGNLVIRNAQPRPIDQAGLPLQEVRTQILLADENIVLNDIAIQFAHAGDAAAHLSGQVHWHTGNALGSVDLAVYRLNPALLDTRLQPASLSGKLALRGDQAAQQGSIQLHDKALKLALEAALSHRDQAITIETVNFSHGDASVSGHGRLQLDADQPFTFEGILKQFNLSALIDAPRSDLNASFKLNGQLAPQPTGKIDYLITRSHYDNQPVMGKGVIALSPLSSSNPSMQLISDASLRLGDNLLQAKGRLGSSGDRLLLTLSAPNLAQTGLPLQGDLNARFALEGQLDRPGIVFEANSTQFNYRGEHQLANFKTKGSRQGKKLMLDLETGAYRKGNTQPYLHKLTLTLVGTEAQHQLSLTGDIDQDRQLQFQVSGGLNSTTRNHAAFQWRGAIDRLTLTGPMPLKLITQPKITLDAEQFTLGHTRLAVASGNLDIQKVYWTPKNWTTQGTFEQIVLTPNVDAPEMADPLTVSGSWQLAADRQLNGNIRLQRTHGDWILPLDTPFALGLQTLSLDLLTEGNVINGQLVIEGTHIGKTQARVSLPLQHTGDAWHIAPDALLSGNLKFDLPDLSWIGPAIDDNFLSGGKLAGNATLSGTPEAPLLQGVIQSQALSLTLLDEGLQLQDGKLAVRFDQDSILLDALSFNAPLEKPSKDRLLKGLKLARQNGQINLNGHFDLRSQIGELHVAFDHLPLVQQPDRWIVVSGDNRIGFKDRALAVKGKIVTEVGFLKQPEAGRPVLDDDVIIISETESAPESPVLAINVDATLDLGERFYLRASGLEGQLAGQLRLRSTPNQALSAIGSIATRNTRFEAYGQKLLVKRGIVNFDGPLDNPGLNILAVRSNLSPDGMATGQSGFSNQPDRDSTMSTLTARNSLQVEAGVEVAGTVRNPKIKLVSQPDVPDTDKLSWLILGRAPDAGGLDSGLLLGAASSIFGGQSDEGMLDKITQGLGLDNISVRQREGSSALTDQIGTVGKRLSSRAYLSYERGLTNASTGVARLTYALFPNISLVARAGEDSALDLFYNFGFD